MTHLEHVSKASLLAVVEKVFELNWFKAILVSFGAVWASMFEGHTEIMAIVPMMIVLDAITGFSAAWMKHDIKSSFFYRSPLKAAIYFVFIVVARAVDMFAPGDYFTYMMSFFIVATEAISILENAHKMGVNVPHNVLNRLKEFNDTRNEVKKDS